jgi:hypothetical protein
MSLQETFLIQTLTNSNVKCLFIYKEDVTTFKIGKYIHNSARNNSAANILVYLLLGI